MKKYAFLIGLLCFILINACKKEKENFNAVGYWKGTYSNAPAAPPTIEFCFVLFHSDGTSRWYVDPTDTNGLNKASGTYTIESDSIINVDIPNWSEKCRLKIRVNSTKLVGTWGNTPNNNDGGHLDLVRQ
ncbi:MAG: hypothetical protein R2807_05255 [Chitinophagales bacterium]